jgi:cytochrome oxidase assembly protein ShyY1
MSEVPVRPPESFADADFLRVRLEGGYERGHDFLVDNRTHEGQTGYWVVSVFRSTDGRGYLVNRGWLAAPVRRETMPAVPTPEGDTRIVGLVWPDTGLPPLLAEDPWNAGWPKRVQRLERERMAGGVVDTVPVEIRLEAGQAGVFAPAPVDAVFRPERNQGYAVQWFGLALVLIIGYGYFGMRGGEAAA